MNFNNDHEINPSQFHQEGHNFNRNYSFEMDKSKIFWVFILSTLVITFIFIFGYWMGQQNSSSNYLKAASVNSLDIDNTLSKKEKKLPLEENEIPLDTPSTIEENTIDEKDLNIIDNANQKNISKNSSTKNNFKSDINTPSYKVKIRKLDSNKVIQNKTVSKEVNKKATIKPYVIQLATLQSKKGAESLRDSLRKKGFSNVFVIKKGILYRVRYGYFESYKEAKKFENGIKQASKIKEVLILKVR